MKKRIVIGAEAFRTIHKAAHRPPHDAASSHLVPPEQSTQGPKESTRNTRGSSGRKQIGAGMEREGQTYLDNHLGLEAFPAKKRHKLQYRSEGALGKAE